MENPASGSRARFAVDLFRDLVEGHAANLGSRTCLGECHHKNREE